VRTTYFVRPNIRLFNLIAAAVLLLTLLVPFAGVVKAAPPSTTISSSAQTLGNLNNLLGVNAGTSGIVYSRKNPGVLWLVNDQRDRPDGGSQTLYAIDPAAWRVLARYTVTTAAGSPYSWTDMEDMATGPGGSTGWYLYLYENLPGVGTNHLLRIEEPIVTLSQPTNNTATVAVDRDVSLNFSLSSNVEVETLAYDSTTDTALFVERRRSNSGCTMSADDTPNRTWKADNFAAQVSVGSTVQLTSTSGVAGRPLGAPNNPFNMIGGGDISVDGHVFGVNTAPRFGNCTNRDAYATLRYREDGQTWDQALAAQVQIAYGDSRQALTFNSESFAFATDMSHILYGPEFGGSGGVLYRKNITYVPPTGTPPPPPPPDGDPVPTTVVAPGSSWRYNASGTDLGTAWRGVGYSDGSWPVGNTQFGFGENDQATTIPNNGITSYYRTTFDVADISQVTALDLNLVRDDGAVVYVNGVEVNRQSMPGGTVTFGTLANWTPNAEENAWHAASLSPANLVNGANTLAVEVHNSSASSSDVSFDLELILTATDEGTPPPPPPPPPPPTGFSVVAAAGDIASCSSPGDEQTASVVSSIFASGSGSVATVGDHAYNDGTTAEFANCYDPTWGEFKDITYPAVGNHEYHTSGATPYYNYFGARAGDPTQGYYSYDIDANWHAVVLNSMCAEVAGGGCGASSAQTQWLRADLAANSDKNVLAYWHHPRFTKNNYNDHLNVQPLWQALYDFGVDLALAGHEHHYERYMPLDANGLPDSNFGIREFIVGTGGIALRPQMQTPSVYSETRNFTDWGVLKLTLTADSYAWDFVHVAGGTYTDSGSQAVHGAPSTPPPPPPPAVEDLPIDPGSAWLYNDSGANLGTAWRGAGYDDSSWSNGPAQLGFGDGDEATVTIKNGITTYFRKKFNVSDVSAISDLTLNLVRDDGAVVYLNGVEVVRSNMPSGTINFDTNAASTIAGADESAWNVFTVSKSSLVNGTNTIAVEIHNNGSTSSDISFDLELIANTAPTPPPPGPDTTLPEPFSGFTAGTVFNGPSVTLSGTATDNVGVTQVKVGVRQRFGSQLWLQANGTFAASTIRHNATVTNAGSQSVGWSYFIANLPSNDYLMSVYAIDAANNWGPIASWVTFSVN